ncbi:MAG: hypothetical protein AB1896_14855 [Thermodesulfobacteriota bacterium]
MLSHPPRGLIANLVTPLDKEGRPDGPALAGLMRRIGSEVAGFLAGGLAVGEALYLGREERLAILAAALEGCQGDRTLFFEITAGNKEETQSLLAGAEELLSRSPHRTAVFFFLTPLAYHSNRELPRHVRELGGSSRRRFIIGNDPDLVTRLRPGPHHKNIRTAVLKKLGGAEMLAGVAFAGDMPRALNYQRALKQRTVIRFYDQSEANFIERPSSSGLISVGATLIPAAWSDIVGSSLNVYDAQRLYPDHLSQIWRHGRTVRTMLDLYQPNPEAFIKTALTILGVIPSAHLVQEHKKLNAQDRRRLEDTLREVHLL